MPADPWLDRHADDPGWGHHTAAAADLPGATLHYVRQGQGDPARPTVLLLHGWPGFWYDYRRVLPRLAERYDVIAPDYLGFGVSSKPDLPPAAAYSSEAQAARTLGLLDTLGIESAIVVGYDIGGRVGPALARLAPARVRGLVLGAPPYAGIGDRRFLPATQREFWYQHFHRLPHSHLLVGESRETVRLYLSHFYDHWVGRKESVRPAEFAAIVDTYARPGAIRGGFSWYRAGAGTAVATRLDEGAGAQTTHPAVVLWGELDPVLSVEWSDRIPEFFTGLLALKRLAGIGHFIPFEAPDEIVAGVDLVAGTM